MRYIRVNKHKAIIELEPCVRTLRYDFFPFFSKKYRLSIPYQIFTFVVFDSLLHGAFLYFARESLRYKTPLYCPPLTNVSKEGNLCLGRDYYGELEHIAKRAVHDYWQSAFNRELDSAYYTGCISWRTWQRETKKDHEYWKRLPMRAIKYNEIQIPQ